jgi:glycerol uptake facilitator-like aquaporin
MRTIVWHSALEFSLTSVLLFGVVTIVRWVIGTEALSMFVIVLIIGLCLSVPRLASMVPWIVGLLIGGAIALLGTASGGSENRAREFGPAIASGQTRFLWAYLLAPVLAAVLAAAARRAIGPMHHRGSQASGGSR